MFDIFNHRFFFRIGKRSSNTTLFSIIVSLCVFLPLLILFIILLVGVFNRTTPHINVQEMDAVKRPTVDLNALNYRMGLKFQTKNGSILDPSELSKYFEIKVGSRLIKNNIESQTLEEEKLFDFQPCQRNDFLDFQDYYDMNLQKAICLKNHSVLLEGYWDESKISFAYIDIRLCDQNTNSLCKSREEIAKTFRGGYVYLHTETQNVNSLNYQQPLILTMKSVQFMIDTNVRNEISLYMQKMHFASFDGLIYNGKAEDWDYYKQTYYTSNSMSISQDENLIWSCFFLSSTKLLTIERYYSTLVDVAGTVGGISKFLIIIGFVITAIYNDRVLLYKLVKELYDFNAKRKSHDLSPLSSKNIPFPSPKLSSQEEEKKLFVLEKVPIENGSKGKENQLFTNQNSENLIENGLHAFNKKIPDHSGQNGTKEEKIIEEPKKTNNYEMVAVNVNEENGSKNDSLQDEIKEEKEEKHMALGKGTLNFSNWELFAYVFLPRALYSKKLKNKVRLLKEGEENLHRYIDVYQMTKRFQEIENLKLVLLNPRQLSLFNHLSKPNLALMSGIKWQRSSSLNQEISESEIVETLQGKEEGNYIDSMLVEMLSEEMKEKIFKKFIAKH